MSGFEFGFDGGKRKRRGRIKKRWWFVREAAWSGSTGRLFLETRAREKKLMPQTEWGEGKYLVDIPAYSVGIAIPAHWARVIKAGKVIVK